MGEKSKRKENRATVCEQRNNTASTSAPFPDSPALHAMSDAELTARREIEQHNGHSLSDKEWNQEKRRLVEFVQILARWDAEQWARSRKLKVN
jgi:hypothetical protein